MCHLCGKCKKANLAFGDCMIVPKFVWTPSDKGGSLKETTKLERKVKKVVALAHSLLVS